MTIVINNKSVVVVDAVALPNTMQLVLNVGIMKALEYEDSVIEIGQKQYSVGKVSLIQKTEDNNLIVLYDYKSEVEELREELEQARGEINSVHVAMDNFGNSEPSLTSLGVLLDELGEAIDNE